MLYSIEARPKLTKESPNLAFTEYAKLIGAQWRAMSDSQKKPYADRASKLKEKYLKEKAKNTGPKRPPSSYMIFSIETRPKLEKKNPDLPFTEYAKLIGAQWRKMSDSHKKKYADQAVKLKEKYLKEKAKFEKGRK